MGEKYKNSGPGWQDVAYQLEAFQRKWGRHAEFKMVGQVSGRRATGRLVVSVWTTREAHTPFHSSPQIYEDAVYTWGGGTLPSHFLRLLTLLDNRLEEASPLPEQIEMFRP